MSGLGVGAGGGAASSGANHPGGDSGTEVSVTNGTPEVPALGPGALTYVQGEEGTAGYSFIGNGTANMTSVGITLACPGALPLDGYPSTFFRTNFTSLTEWCDQGCGCSAAGSKPDCRGSDITSKDFAAAAASQLCSSTCTCLGGNETVIASTKGYPSIEINSKAYFNTCPMGSFPQGKSASDYRNQSLPLVNLGCQGSNSTIYTLVSFNFNATAAQSCDICPGGYGPDPDCKHQPVPLPQASQGCPQPAAGTSSTASAATTASSSAAQAPPSASVQASSLSVQVSPSPSVQASSSLSIKASSSSSAAQASPTVQTSRKLKRTRRTDRKVRRSADGQFSLPRARKVRSR